MRGPSWEPPRVSCKPSPVTGCAGATLPLQGGGLKATTAPGRAAPERIFSLYSMWLWCRSGPQLGHGDLLIDALDGLGKQVGHGQVLDFGAELADVVPGLDGV